MSTGGSGQSVAGVVGDGEEYIRRWNPGSLLHPQPRENSEREILTGLFCSLGKGVGPVSPRLKTNGDRHGSGFLQLQVIAKHNSTENSHGPRNHGLS